MSFKRTHDTNKPNKKAEPNKHAISLITHNINITFISYTYYINLFQKHDTS